MNDLTVEEKLCNLETMKHIQKVAGLLNKFATELIRRGEVHDQSKLVSPEVEAFAEYTPKLASSTYGSSEYNAFREAMGPALTHHYANNSHHPEHRPKGIDGMDLCDVVEMLVDWYAAGKRHNNGNLYNSITVNKSRFNMSDQLCSIFENTVDFIES